MLRQLDLRKLALFVTLALFLTGTASGVLWAQATSSLNGTVTDPQGAVVVGAKVTVTDLATSVSREIRTDERGSYVVPQLAPGTYEVRVEAQGFKTVLQRSVQLLVATPVTVNIQLKEVGDVSTTVEVAGEYAPLNTVDATQGTALEGRQILQLPLLTRNIFGLLSLQSGVTPDGYVAGARSDQSNLMLDGVDVNDQQNGTAFQSVLRVTPDSVQEFRVTTVNANADQGRSSGAQVNLITRSGTNDFHGAVYWYHRNTVTTANDFFNNRIGIDRPKLIRNQYGFALGGPIKKERAFFFFNFEGRRDASQSTEVHEVPLASLGQGIVKYENISGGITSLKPADINQLYPGIGTNPAAIAALATAAAKYPANDFSIGDGLNTAGFRFNAPRPRKEGTWILRLDYNITQDGKHRLFARGNYQNDKIGNAPRFPDTPAPDTWSHPKGVAVGYTWIINNNLVNNFRYGYTRDAFTNFGDSTANQIFFRFIFQPFNFSRNLSRTTPVHNLIEDQNWIKGRHNFQYGANIRLVRNARTSLATSFDTAIINPSFYDDSGRVVLDPITDVTDGFSTDLRDSLSAVIGRYSQYSANFNFAQDGQLQPVGDAVARVFVTQEYEFYFQDTWKMRHDLTLTLGMRWGTSTPVYEANGFEAKPTVSLNDYFQQRVAGARSGVPFNDLISFDLSGKVNNKSGLYKQDWNNWAPRFAAAWEPHFENGLLKAIFGSGGKSVFRGGFGVFYDRIGSALAVNYDLNNALGFSSTYTASANTYNVTDRPAPLFTGFNQTNIRTFPGVVVPAKLTFPLSHPADFEQRIETALDDSLVTPKNYSWNVSFSREFKHGIVFEAAYLGRQGRNLLATRDIMHLNDLVDPASGMDFYAATRIINDFRLKGTPVSQIPIIPYFQNLFPGYTSGSLNSTQRVYRFYAPESAGGFGEATDWTFLQLRLNRRSKFGPDVPVFFQPQYGALSAWSTIASSDYHAGTFSVRQRFKNSLLWSFNYTVSKSLDDASGLQNGAFYGLAFIVNPLDLRLSRSFSDFDLRHVINANWLWEFPLGKGRMLGGNMPGWADAIFGGWQVSGIFRWNSGAAAGGDQPFDAAQWATNWNVQSFGVAMSPIAMSNSRSGPGGDAPNWFADPDAAYRSYRNALAGEVGDRNTLRLPNFINLDLGLSKRFKMPYREGHSLQFRWELFNVTNTQRFQTPETTALDLDPFAGSPPSGFGRFTAIQGTPRVMQFALRYEF